MEKCCELYQVQKDKVEYKFNVEKLLFEEKEVRKMMKIDENKNIIKKQAYSFDYLDG